jgi:hypothetical protein
MEILGHSDKDTNITSNAFQITAEEVEISNAFLKEAQIDLTVYDELEKSTFPDEIKIDVERRKLFLLQQASEKAVKGALPRFVRMTALPLLAIGVWFDKPPVEINRVIDIYKKRVAESLNRTFNKKRLGHNLSKSFETNQLFEDLLTILTLVFKAETDLLDYIYESSKIIKSKDLDKVLKGQQATKIAGSLEDLRIKAEKYQKEGYNEENAIFATRQFFVFNAVSLGVTAQSIGLLNILADFEQSSRYPDLPKLDENNPILKRKKDIRTAIFQFVEVNKSNYR